MGWPGPLTHRQFEAWWAWRFLDVNMPDRADFYQMQTACEVRRVLQKDPAAVRLDHFLLNFPEPNAVPAQVDRTTRIDRQLAGMRKSILARGGFSREQVEQIIADARKRLEEQDDG